MKSAMPRWHGALLLLVSATRAKIEEVPFPASPSVGTPGSLTYPTEPAEELTSSPSPASELVEELTSAPSPASVPVPTEEPSAPFPADAAKGECLAARVEHCHEEIAALREELKAN